MNADQTPQSARECGAVSPNGRRRCLAPEGHDGEHMSGVAYTMWLEHQLADPETASERPDAGLSRDWYTLSHIVGGIEDDPADEVFERARKVVAAADRADAAEAEVERWTHIAGDLTRRADAAETKLAGKDGYIDMLRRQRASAEAERDEARAKLDEIRDRAVGFHAFLLGPGSRNPDQVRTRAVGALDGIRAVFEDATDREEPARAVEEPAGEVQR